MKLKAILLVALGLLLALNVGAQERLISAQLTDAETKEPMEQATVQLLHTDSTYAGGTLSNSEGIFKLKAPKDARYILRISSVGYQTIIKHVQISEGKNLALGKIVMKADAKLLKEAQVVGKALKVTVKEDTFIYNSAAYRTPEGSTIEELVKRLPGVEVDENGNITHN